jgi:hypothetical protein
MRVRKPVAGAEADERARVPVATHGGWLPHKASTRLDR